MNHYTDKTPQKATRSKIPGFAAAIAVPGEVSGGSSGARSAPLGKITDIASAGIKEHISAIRKRYLLQDAARELLPGERVRICHRCRVPEAATVDIHYHNDDGGASYSGLMKCQSVWVCPVCAGRISEERRRELFGALDAARDRYLPVLVTYTLRHTKADDLGALLDALADARRRMKSGRFWQYLKEDFSWVGSVSSTEITYGVNGWHPHVHELALLDLSVLGESFTPEYIAGALQTALRKRWLDVLPKVGADASWAHGVDVRGAYADVTDYVTKFGKLPQLDEHSWTIVHETAKASVKSGRQGGRSPWELLWDYSQGDKPAGRLFAEYATATKGKNQLVWSRGLKALLGLDAEAENVAEQLPDPVILAELTHEQWWVVLVNRARADVLELASWGDKAALYQFLAGLPGMTWAGLAFTNDDRWRSYGKNKGPGDNAVLGVTRQDVDQGTVAGYGGAKQHTLPDIYIRSDLLSPSEVYSKSW